jgi:hypothetical protein
VQAVNPRFQCPKTKAALLEGRLLFQDDSSPLDFRHNSNHINKIVVTKTSCMKNSTPTFPYFPLLLKELRLKIWGLAFPGPYTIKQV